MARPIPFRAWQDPTAAVFIDATSDDGADIMRARNQVPTRADFARLVTVDGQPYYIVTYHRLWLVRMEAKLGRNSGNSTAAAAAAIPTIKP